MAATSIQTKDHRKKFCNSFKNMRYQWQRTSMNFYCVGSWSGCCSCICFLFVLGWYSARNSFHLEDSTNGHQLNNYNSNKNKTKKTTTNSKEQTSIDLAVAVAVALEWFVQRHTHIYHTIVQVLLFAWPVVATNKSLQHALDSKHMLNGSKDKPTKITQHNWKRQLNDGRTRTAELGRTTGTTIKKKAYKFNFNR